MKKLFFLLIFAVFSVLCFAQIKVISPIEGTYANRQMLVIDTGATADSLDCGDYYYSLDGSDPQTFGFAYDGPVLIDLDGPVELRISKAGKVKQEVNVKYTVIPDNALTTQYGSFISTFFDSGILNYTSGTILSIPSELKYSFGLPPDSFLQGRDLSISELSVLSRFVPCTLLDEASGKKWRFVIRTLPQSAGVFSRRDVPFTITDWDTITFTNRDYIYKIDSEYWGLPKNSITLDRSVSHMIKWQSLAYEEGNPIDYFVLPPKPELKQEDGDDGSIVFTLEGSDSYTMSVLSSDNGNQSQYQELFTQLGVDTFYGDNVSGFMNIGFYANAVYQGMVQIPFSINKRPPSNPVITSSAKSFYSREPVTLSIIGEEYSDLYYAISEPYVITSSSEVYSQSSPIFTSIQVGSYTKADSNKVNLELAPNENGAVYFKVSAFSQNDNNPGHATVYSVIIDQYNYYYNSYADASVADGTSLRPYATFEQCLAAVNKGRYACLRLKGLVKVPMGVHYILSNCVFVNEGDASFEFEQGASIVVRSSNLTIQDFTISSSDDKSIYEIEDMVPYFKLEDSVLDMNNCQISALFDKNGLFVEANRSSVNIKGTIASVSAGTYGSFISGIRTNVNIQNSSVNVTANTCVTLSLNQGNIYLNNNSFKISGEKGRIAELFAIDGSLVLNSFKSSLRGSSNAEAIYTDKNCTIQFQNNDSYGF